MSIFPIIAISIIAGLTRFITKTWISPGAFFTFCWSFFLIVPVIFAPNYEIDHMALWFIAVFATALGLGSTMAYSLSPLYPQDSFIVSYKSNDKILFYSLILFSVISYFFLLFVLIIYLFSPHLF